MTLVIHPPVEPARLEKIAAAAAPMRVVNAATEAEAIAAMPEADAFFGKITPALLQAARRLRWVQTATASLEHYVFPALVEHPCTLTNMRGLFSDNIADQVMGYVICFARNLHTYIRQQLAAKWAPVGGEAERVGFATGPAQVTAIDRAHRHLGDLTLGVIGLGAIGAEIARRRWPSRCAWWRSIRSAKSRRRVSRRCGGRSGYPSCWARAISLSSRPPTRPGRRSSFAGRSFGR